MGFKKERIKGGEKIKRKNTIGVYPATAGGDFDVFASCPLGNPRINSLVAAKKQPGGEEIPTPQDLLSPKFILTIRVKWRKVSLSWIKNIILVKQQRS